VTAETSLEGGPLTGIRVVEFGQLIAGPFVGTLLADFGADVIKVEAPPKGDALREWGRHRHIPRVAPSNVYRSKDDRWVVIAANHDTLWRRLAELMGRPELADDERFATHAARGENQGELDAMVAEWASGHTAEELDRIVNDAGVVCAPVYTVADIYEDPYFRERDLLVEIEDDVHGRMSVPGVVPKLTATPGRIRRPARWEVGADTSDVLGDLDEEVEGLDLPRREGVA
jgi:crotonobetainyl-CoA:carnitine CoA-transferase CaiB-like acyl-CoA transferase